MSLRKIRSRIKSTEKQLQQLTQRIPEGCFVTSSILEGGLPVFKESVEYQMLLPQLVGQGINPSLIALVTRNYQQRSSGYIYHVYPFHGPKQTVRINPKYVTSDNNVFHHPELLGQSTLPHYNDKKQPNKCNANMVTPPLRIDHYFTPMDI